MSRKEKLEMSLSILLKFSIGFIAILSLARQEYFLIFASLFFFCISFLPTVINRRSNVYLPPIMDLAITVVLYNHFFLGMHKGFYYKFPWWDLALHLSNSVVIGFIGFGIVYSLMITKQVLAKPFFISLYAVLFATTIGVFWEIFEFLADTTFGTNMLSDGIVDTMTDLIADIIGASVVALAGFFYLRNPHPGIFEKAVDWSPKSKKRL